MQQQGRIAIDVHGIFYRQTENEEQQQELGVQDSLECAEEVEGNDLEDTKDLSNVQRIVEQGVVKRQSKVTAETQLQNLSRLIKAKESNIKKLEIVDTNKITTKLYQQKAIVCSKGCKKHQQPIVKQKPVERASKERQMSARGVHDRLYNMSKSQLLREKYLPSLPERAEPQRTLSASKSSKYLRNYVPFEKRLEEHLLLGQLAHSCKKASEDQFKPRLFPNKYTEKIQARYNKHEIRQLRPSDIAEFLNSSVSSSLSSQSRSASIINRIEEHFIAKVKLIFMENSEEVIQVNEETIGLLTEVEFDILQPFIMEIEEKGIKGADFQTKFREFYESLRLGDRLQLRNHETKTRGKYREMRQQAKQKTKTPKKPEQKIEPKPTKSFKKETAKGDYHLAIQQFI